MNRLGLRLATAGGRGAVGGLALTALAVAIGTAILLAAASFLPALADRDQRTAWRDGFEIANEGGTLVVVVEDRFEGRLVTRVHVAPSGAATGTADPVPPPLQAMPESGESYISPALAELLATVPADRLGDRFGRVVGTIDGQWLASPDELLAIVGSQPDVLRSAGAFAVQVFGTEPAPIALPPVGALIVVLAAVGAMVPVAVFVSTATRMSAARRESRLAALRLVGATPNQVARLATIEALVATSTGALGGVVLFLLARPLVARIPLDNTTWWPEAISPPVPLAIAVLVAVQVVGAAGALVAMRRLTVTPLGVQRRSQPARPSAARVVPTGLAIVALLLAIAAYRSSDVPGEMALAAAGVAFAGIIAGIAYAGPWLTSLVGRALQRVPAGASTLLAARRLDDEPRGSFGAIAGVIMAVFVASAFFTFSAYTGAQAGLDTDPKLRTGDIEVELGGGATTPGTELQAALLALPGVTDAVPMTHLALVRDGGIVGFAWLAPCADIARVMGLDEAGCSASGITSVAGATFSGTYTVTPELSHPNGLPQPTATLDIAISPSAGLLGVRGDIAPFLPDLVIDPTVLGAPTAAAFAVSRVHVATDGSDGVDERVRTTVVAREPAAFVRFEAERLAMNSQFEEIGRIVAMGLVGTLALAGCSLALAVTTATLERRRQFVFLRSGGMPASGLRSTILLQAGVPLTAVAVVSAVLGAIVGVAVLWVAAGTLALPDASLVGIVAGSVLVAMAIVVLTLPPLERMTRPASLRHE
jgi:hypothetical protein